MEQKVCFLEQNKKTSFLLGGFKMRIALCDLDKNFLTRLKGELYHYAELNKIEIVVDCYISGENMIKSDINYNLIFLGYDLKGNNGLKTAEILRENCNNSPIIFVSDRTDFIIDAFKVCAFRFLLKSNWTNELFAVLDDYFKKFSKDYPLWVKSGEETVCISTGEIYFLEADNKHCYIHLKSETLYCNKTMARVFSVLPKSHFSKTNRAYVVNLNHISRYNNDVIVLKNGKILHPSRNYYKSFKEEYRRFLRPCEI